jgi:hypothetical protein
MARFPTHVVKSNGGELVSGIGARVDQRAMRCGRSNVIEPMGRPPESLCNPAGYLLA